MKTSSPAGDSLERLAEGWLAYHRAAETEQQGVLRMPESDELLEFVIQMDNLVRKEPGNSVACNSDGLHAMPQ